METGSPHCVTAGRSSPDRLVSAEDIHNTCCGTLRRSEAAQRLGDSLPDIDVDDVPDERHVQSVSIIHQSVIIPSRGADMTP